MLRLIIPRSSLAVPFRSRSPLLCSSLDPLPRRRPSLQRRSTPSSLPLRVMASYRQWPHPPPPSADADKDVLYNGLEATLGRSFGSEPLGPPRQPLILVISGPSGVGKDAVIKRLQELRQDIHIVVTATSRAMRPGEVDGKDYYFMTKEEFLAMIERDELLEHAMVYGEYKGIPKKQIREYMARGHDIILRVDIQGAATLRQILGESAVFIFLVAESEAALVKRLIGRKTESSEMLLVRINTMREELKYVKNFDYVVVNAEGKLEDAVKLVESIVDAEKAKVHRSNPWIDKISKPTPG